MSLYVFVSLFTSFHFYIEKVLDWIISVKQTVLPFTYPYRVQPMTLFSSLSNRGYTIAGLIDLCISSLLKYTLAWSFSTNIVFIAQAVPTAEINLTAEDKGKEGMEYLGVFFPLLPDSSSHSAAGPRLFCYWFTLVVFHIPCKTWVLTFLTLFFHAWRLSICISQVAWPCF